MHLLFQADGDAIWVACSPLFAITTVSHDRFVELVGESKEVTFYAHPVNAALALELLRDASGRTHIALSPAGAPRTPHEAIDALTVSSYSSMLHNRVCRHVVSDVPAWLLAAADTSDEDLLRQMLSEHAVYPLASFCATLRPVPLANLVGQILTPERFVHPTMPSRWTRVYSWCQLSLESAERFLDGEPCGNLPYLAYASWASNAPAGRAAAGAFLHRVAGPKMTPRGLLRGTRYWLSLLMRYWASAQQKSGDCRQAKLWFNREEEWMAFARHLDLFRGRA